MQFQHFLGDTRARKPSDFGTICEIPHLSEQGISLAKQGVFSEEQGNLKGKDADRYFGGQPSALAISSNSFIISTSNMIDVLARGSLDEIQRRLIEKLRGKEEQKPPPLLWYSSSRRPVSQRAFSAHRTDQAVEATGLTSKLSFTARTPGVTSAATRKAFFCASDSAIPQRSAVP